MLSGKKYFTKHIAESAAIKIVCIFYYYYSDENMTFPKKKNKRLVPEIYGFMWKFMVCVFDFSDFDSTP